jgi:serine/threonine-protein kinase
VVAPVASGTELKLSHKTWRVVAPLAADASGFGDLYIVGDEQGDEAVAKLVERAPGAERELLIGVANEAAQHRNVVPIIDNGEHDDAWVLVMPRAEASLKKYLEDRGGFLEVDEAVRVLTDVATALADINGVLVHRDLKPANILLLNGAWSLADFGLARYAEASTGTDTWKYNATRQYASPEQWRGEHATEAADVYAFGVVGYQLLTGQLPFPGPDFRQQHLNDQAPALTVGSMRLRDLIEGCLYKPPETRPTPTAILKRLEKTAEQPTAAGLKKLAQANRDEVQRQAGAHAKTSADRQQRQWREQMHATAVQAFARVGQEIVETIQGIAPTAKIERGPAPERSLRRTEGKLLIASLNGADLGLDQPQMSPATWTAPFTVISESVIIVTRPHPTRDGWVGRSHSLWFCDAKEKNRFAWYELAFWQGALGGHPSIDPTAASAQQTHIVFEPVMGTIELARPFTALDRSDLSEFLERWLGWFGEAAAGDLQRPSLPEGEPQGSWRKN